MTLPVLDMWQFRLSLEAQPDAIAVADAWLAVGKGLPVTRMLDAEGHVRGVLLGFVLDIARCNVPDREWRAASVFDPQDPDTFMRDVLHGLGGRFLVVLATEGMLRVYPDSGGRMTCVYDRQSGHVGTTAAALLDAGEYDARLRRDLYEQLGVDGEGWFPAGLTAHEGVERLLPGHYLDVKAGRFQRFWPLAEVKISDDPMALLDTIIETIQAQIEAIIAGGRRPAIALTAGHDTRVVLACARPYLENIDVTTVVGDGRHSRDTIVARRIVQQFGLNHVELPRRTATAEQREIFIRRGGHCNADSNSWFHPSTWPLAERHVFVGGSGGECARGFLWRAGDHADMAISAGMLCHRFGLPEAEEVVAAFQAWLDALPPGQDAFSILDLAYRENRTGPWSSVQFCCDPTVIRHAPMLSWPVIERMATLPVEWRQNSRLGREIIARCWPELGQIPYNSLGPWKDLLFRLQRVVANPRVIIKKWRKLRG